MKKIVRVLPPLGVAAGALVLLAAPAGAHVSPDAEEVAAGGRATVGFATSHGCEESPTNAMVFEIPEQIVSVNPVVHPGWKIDIAMEELAEPIEGAHGAEPVTERAKTVTFSATRGNELVSGIRDSFGLSFQVPEDAEGETLFFKVIQKCPDGETPWIEEFTGEGEEPEHPAPAVVVGPAAPEEGEEVAAEPASTETEVAAPAEDDGSSSDGLAIAGIVMGTLGLAAGGYSILKGNRKPAAG